jgi:Fe2+ transport system protein FeoA
MEVFESRGHTACDVATLSLDGSRKGSRVTIRKLPQGASRTQLIRLGIVEGAEVRVTERLPGGTIVIEKNRREIAIGAALARTIRVELVGKVRAVADA